MGRRQINEDITIARFPKDTLKRIRVVLKEGEGQADFLREAVERELKRRERPAR